MFNAIRRIALRELKNIRYLVDLFGSVASSPLNEKEAILVFGTPRSGTTWVMEILEALPEYKTIFRTIS